jgi:hypothetical protein
MNESFSFHGLLQVLLAQYFFRHICMQYSERFNECIVNIQIMFMMVVKTYNSINIK